MTTGNEMAGAVGRQAPSSAPGVPTKHPDGHRATPDTSYLDACLAGVADHLGISPADIRSGADARSREARAIVAWFARGQVDVHQVGWDMIAAVLGYETAGDAIGAVKRVEAGGSKLHDPGGQALAIMARFHGGVLALRPPTRRPAEGDSEADSGTPAWDPEQDGCEDADDLELPFPDWLQDPDDEVPA